MCFDQPRSVTLLTTKTGFPRPEQLPQLLQSGLLPFTTASAARVSAATSGVTRGVVPQAHLPFIVASLTPPSSRVRCCTVLHAGNRVGAQGGRASVRERSKRKSQQPDDHAQVTRTWRKTAEVLVRG